MKLNYTRWEKLYLQSGDAFIEDVGIVHESKILEMPVALVAMGIEGESRPQLNNQN